MHRAAYTFLVLTTLLWAGNAVAGKLAVGHISPLLLTTLRWAIAVVILLAIGWPRVRRDWPVIRANLALLFMLGAIGFALFNATFYTALNFTSAINVSIEQAGMPAMIILLNFLLFRMRVTAAQIVGFVLSLVGVALTASHGNLLRLAELEVNVGDLLMILAVTFYASYTVALRFKPQLHWQSLMFVLAASAFVCTLPLVAWEYSAGDLILPDARGWSVAAYTAIFPSILAQSFFIRGNELIGGNRAGLFINLVPIFGTTLSVLLLGEAFQLYHAIAIVLVLGGIWLAENSGRKLAARRQ